MSRILNRDEFGQQIDKFKDGKKINEGLFQFLKSFFKQDWANIKSKNAEIKNKLEELDGDLEGYTILKRSNYDACTQFRQAICDFANATLEYKLYELDKEKEELRDAVMIDDEEYDGDFTPSKNVRALLGKNGCRDKAMQEKIQDSADEVADVISKFPVIEPWAKALKRSVKNFINDVIIAQSEAPDGEDENEFKEEKEKLEDEIEEQEDEDEEEIEQENKEAEKEQEEEIKDLEKERQKNLTNVGVTPLTGIDGNKALTQLKGEFDNLVKPLKLGSKEAETSSTTEEGKVFDELNMLFEGNKKVSTLEKTFSSDKHFGFPTIIKTFNEADFSKIASACYKKGSKDDDKSFGEKIKQKVVNIYFEELNQIYGKIEGYTKTPEVFKDVTSDSVQAMYVGIALSVGYGLTGDTCKNYFLSEGALDLMTKCSIESDATIGYSFPLVDEKKPDEGTIFVALMKILADAKDEAHVFKKVDTKLLEYFKKNMSVLFKQIIDNANKLKEEANKEKEAEAKKAEEEK